MKNIVAATLLCASACASAGSLEPPPGPPSPTFKTLQQIEPRIPLSQASSNGASIVLDAPGSYYLTENIYQVGPAAGYDLVQITSAFVTLDLNGFALVGSSEVFGGDGIQVNAGNVRIQNGTVSGFTGDGIKCVNLTGISVIDITSTSNGGDGLDCTAVAVHDGEFSGNASLGIRTVSAARILGATAHSNGGNAISVGPRAIVARASADTLIECGAGGGAMVIESSGGPIGGNGISGNCVRYRSVPTSP